MPKYRSATTTHGRNMAGAPRTVARHRDDRR